MFSHQGLPGSLRKPISWNNNLDGLKLWGKEAFRSKNQLSEKNGRLMEE